jgi:hypothetical protein
MRHAGLGLELADFFLELRIREASEGAGFNLMVLL